MPTVQLKGLKAAGLERKVWGIAAVSPGKVVDVESDKAERLVAVGYCEPLVQPEAAKRKLGRPPKTETVA